MKLIFIFLIAVFFVKSVHANQDKDVIATIQDINRQFATETNVFFDFDGCLAGEHLATLHVPQILITHQVNFQFIYAFNKDILAVACLSQRTAVEIQSSLIQVLHRMHHVNVMFILLDPKDLHSIFDWAWKNGFKNSISVYLNEEGLQLFNLQPFPHPTPGKIQKINQSTLQKPITDFHHHPIRTLMANDPPRSFRYVNRQGKLIYTGLFLKLFVLFVDHYNATIEEVFLPEPYPDNFIASDMIKALKEGKLDISPHPYLQLYDQYLCTDAFQLAHFYLMVPYSRPVDQFMYFVLPFDARTWIAITLTVFLFAVGIFAGSKAALGRFEFGRALLQAFSGILNISYNFRTYNLKMLHFLFVLLSVVGIMLSNMYLAQLSTFLTTHAYKKQINTIEDAIASELPLSIAKYNMEVYKSLGAPKDLFKHVEIIDIETWHHQRRILNTSRLDIIDTEKFSFFIHQQRYLQTPRVKMLDQPLMGLAPAFALPFTSPYVSLYSDFFQRAIEAGIFNKFKNDLNDDGIATGMIAFIEPDAPERVPLSLQHFKISLFLLGGGFAISVMCFCVEIVYGRIRRNYGCRFDSKVQ